MEAPLPTHVLAGFLAAAPLSEDQPNNRRQKTMNNDKGWVTFTGDFSKKTLVRVSNQIRLCYDFWD